MLPFETTAEVEPGTGIIGQDSAIEALRFGLEINAAGQNVFVRGISGTGRMTTLRRLLEEIQPACPLAQDRCYVFNFRQPDRPRLITLPRGTARRFERHMNALADFLRDDLGASLRSEGIRARRMAIEQATQEAIDGLARPFEADLRQAGIALVSVHAGTVIQTLLFPIFEDQPVPPEEWEKLAATGRITREQYEHYFRVQKQFLPRLREVTQSLNELSRAHAARLRDLVESSVRAILIELVNEIIAAFPEDDVRAYLQELMDDVVTRQRDALFVDEVQAESDDTRRYRVHVVLAHDAVEGCPIIIENAPTLSNLLGTIDRYPVVEGGSDELAVVDHFSVRPGSLLMADGGYLVLDARDVIREPGAWTVLIRTLRTGRLEIVPPELSWPFAGPYLKPQPIDVNLKVVLLGDSFTYYLLDEIDPDFRNLFKVLADFDTEISRTAHGALDYGTAIARLAREDNLLPFHRTAVAALIEHGARIAARKDKLTARFGRLADVAREAAFLASRAGRDTVTAVDVHDAISRGKHRGSLPSRKFREMVREQAVCIAVQGSCVGQVNGLAVLKAGPLTYGFPARITATIGAGTAGVINIEREAALSGAIHTKGFFILGGLLRNLLRTRHPLAFDASVAFEQSYGGIDGDSASGAEICCLLSALTRVPLRQDLAVTGAIDQIGNLLAIGAVNEKIEGFYDLCQDAGLTGTQGVIIPLANAPDLMLREDVVQACARGAFHVYAAADVRAVLELLTGCAAGLPDDDDQYPPDTVLGSAVAQAHVYWQMAARSASQA